MTVMTATRSPSDISNYPLDLRRNRPVPPPSRSVVRRTLDGAMLKRTTTNHDVENSSRASNSCSQSKRASLRAWSEGWFREYLSQNSEGDTRLHIAVVQQVPVLVASLIREAPHERYLDVKNDDGQTALHVAVITRQTEVVTWLMEGGANTCLRDGRGNTALHLACQMGDITCVKALTKSRNKALKSTLPKPCQMEDVSRVKEFTTSDIKAHLNNRQIEYSKEFIKPRVGGDAQTLPMGDVPIKSYQVEDVICEHRQNCCREVMDDVSCPKGDGEILPRELSAVNYEGETCVHVAANNDHMEALRWLVLCGADVNARDAKSGNTILHNALERRRDELSRFLLEECEGVDLGVRNYAGVTPRTFMEGWKLSRRPPGKTRHCS